MIRLLYVTKEERAQMNGKRHRFETIHRKLIIHYLNVAENRMKVIIIFRRIFFSLLDSISGLHDIEFSQYLNAIVGFGTYKI